MCEPQCGLIAEVDSGKVVSLRPDRDHPVTQGYACQKGLAMTDVHLDPDRLNYPLRRTENGELRRRTWDDALGEIGSQLQSLIERYGPNAVGLYCGNPSAFNSLFGGVQGTLARSLGTTRVFDSSTQDCANKFVTSEALYGGYDIHPIPDLENTRLSVVFGGNPRVSQGSFFTAPNIVRQMKQARERGTKFVFVNPRKIESSHRGLGDTIQILPDTDLYFLAALINEIDRLGGFDEGVINAHAKQLDKLRAFLQRYDAERTAAVTGVPAATTLALAAEWVAAGAASAHASTGLNMGRQGTLAYWLVQMLIFLTGNLDRAGGNLRYETIFNERPGIGEQTKLYEHSQWGPLRRDRKPGNLLADYIGDASEPMKALLVFAGNPLLSVPGGGRLRQALSQLELLVVVDIYRNATSELADWILPACDMLEREDINAVGFGIAQRPYVQYTPAVVDPAAERRSEWWICQRLLQEIGAVSALDDPGADQWAFWRKALHRAGIDLDDLQERSEIRLLPELRPGTFYTTQLRTSDRKIDCCPSLFSEALEGAHAIYDELERQPPTLRLIGRRDPFMMNSWLQNLERMHRGRRVTNPLHMHPDDARARGLDHGSRVCVRNEYGSIDAVVALDEDLRCGVVAMAHGWGNAESSGMSVARTNPGSNCNALLPSGPGSFEQLSGQAHMVGIPVEVEVLR